MLDYQTELEMATLYQLAGYLREEINDPTEEIQGALAILGRLSFPEGLVQHTRALLALHLIYHGLTGWHSDHSDLLLREVERRKIESEKYVKSNQNRNTEIEM